jgi:NAD(P)H dehydrogenase (quinone)
VSTYTAIAAGNLAGPTSAVHELTGREPLDLAEFLAQSHSI